jgi:hypothetical protein
LAALKQSVALGFRVAGGYRAEPALGALLTRPDFQLLTLDLAMPADPFAGPR